MPEITVEKAKAYFDQADKEDVIETARILADKLVKIQSVLSGHPLSEDQEKQDDMVWLEMYLAGL